MEQGLFSGCTMFWTMGLSHLSVSAHHVSMYLSPFFVVVVPHLKTYFFPWCHLWKEVTAQNQCHLQVPIYTLDQMRFIFCRWLSRHIVCFRWVVCLGAQHECRHIPVCAQTGKWSPQEGRRGAKEGTLGFHDVTLPLRSSRAYCDKVVCAICGRSTSEPIWFEVSDLMAAGRYPNQPTGLTSATEKSCWIQIESFWNW